MKRISTLFLIFLILSVVAFSQSATVIKENANLRGTASQSGRVITVLPNGSDVEVIKQAGGWFLVQSPEFVGWIHGNTIRYNRDFVRNPVSSSEPRYSAANDVPATVEFKTYPEAIESTPAPVTVPSSAPARLRTVEQSATATAICADGTLSYSAHRSGTCSHHGGVSSWLNDPAPGYAPPSIPSSGGTVQVKGYYRKDGTYVRPHTRSAPRRKN